MPFEELAVKALAPASEAPIDTPDGLANPNTAVNALVTAAEKVLERYGSLDVPWGTVHRLVRNDVDLPANGGPGALGIFRVIGYAETEDGRLAARGGDSYVAAVEFSNPVRAKAALGYGNASQPDSPHTTDQLRLFAEKKLRPLWLTRDEIESHLESREIVRLR